MALDRRTSGSNVAVSLTNLMNPATSFAIHLSKFGDTRASLQMSGLLSDKRLRMGASDSTSGVRPVVAVVPVEGMVGFNGPFEVCRCRRGHPLNLGGVGGRKRYGRMQGMRYDGKGEREPRVEQHEGEGVFGPTR